MPTLTASARDSVFERLQGLGRMGIFFWRMIMAGVTQRLQIGVLIRQIHFIGARSMLVIGVAGAFVGMVVALQFYDTLVRFGSVSLLGSAVGLSLIRELAPVLTALIVIGRAGSAMCAELGIMRSDNQIDAIECMAIDAYAYLVTPRFIATVIAVPLLTALFNIIGIGGGWFVGVVIFDLSEGAYFVSMADSVLWRDLAMNLTKATVFGAIIAWVCTGKAFLMHLGREPAFGAEGVSRTTTDAVVIASISILFADYLISALML
ncbi:MAG: ABC transporter permease [Pseudomonadota bacterium]